MSLFADPNITDLLQGEHPDILTGIGGLSKKRFSSYKSCNISKTLQDRTKVTIEEQHEVIQALSIGAKINDLR